MSPPSPLKIGFLGPTSTYSHQAALTAAAHLPAALASTAEFTPYATIPAVFDAAMSAACDIAVVPFENSTNGSVVPCLDVFCDREDSMPDLAVLGVVYVRVRHCLVGNARREDVRKVLSHPQAFGQCERFLAALGSPLREDVTSTSKAVELVARDETGTLAAIAGRAAADKFGVRVIEEGIEDWKQNMTRFFVISRGRHGHLGWKGQGQWKTLLKFRVDEARPGALCDALQVFKSHGLNLTSITSRPSKRSPWDYIFFVEFLGNEADNRAALEELEGIALAVKVFGSFQDPGGERIEDI